MKRLILIVCFLCSGLLWTSCGKSDPGIKQPDPVKPTPDPPVGEDDLTKFTKDEKFTNPVMPGGPDPWVVQKNGTYYYTFTQGSKLVIIETKNLSELASGRRTDVWTPPANQSYSKNVWAPELHEINGKWYFYFAADDGTNANHRMYVLENSSPNPVQGSWALRGKISDPTNLWAIDGTVLDYKGQLYMLWSGGNAGAPPQNIYIAKMSNPWTITGEKVMIATPNYDWEKKGNPINEGPQVLINPDGRVFVVYSGSGYWSDGYCLGLLTLKNNGDPMNPGDWTKNPQPVFSMLAASKAYGPGHNGFFKSPDGKEDWIIYHARSVANDGNAGRNPRIQRFTWNTDGTPNFGTPTNIDIPQNRPSGETVRYIHPKTNWNIAGFSSEVTANASKRIIDGNTSTFWAAAASSDYPNHYVTVDMGAVSRVNGFIINQKSENSKIKELQILTSNDNNTWENLGTFTLNNFDLRNLYIDLPQRKQFRYFRLVPKSGHDSEKQPGLAEVSTFRYKD